VVMELEPGQVFKVMEVAYRKGVMEKFMPLQGEALKKVKERTGFGMAEMSNMMNDAPEKTVKNIDLMLRYAGPFLRLAANETLMGLASRLLDLEVVRKTIVLTNVMLLELMIARNRGTLPPLGERLRGIVRKQKDKTHLTTGKMPGGGE
jgi:hypothetical protein